ncbi:MAG: isoprenyl transferase [Tissierellia bacterium]|nr:isoprenyl transferase [Tissierellia bacterium]
MSIYEQIDMNRLPNHIAIIMDGNGRWAKRRKLPRSFGHNEGAKRVTEIIRCASNLGIKSLSLFAFSTENWKRPTKEIDALMNILVRFINDQIDELNKNNVKLILLGDESKFEDKVRERLEYAINLTKDNTNMILNIALNYGSQQEILRACNNILKDKDKFDTEIDMNTFKKYLYTESQSDIDLLIRPSGELRLSNFLLFQSAYAELYFSDILWPDFNCDQLYKAIVEFQSRDRRFGGLKNE